MLVNVNEYKVPEFSEHHFANHTHRVLYTRLRTGELFKKYNVDHMVIAIGFYRSEMTTETANEDDIS